MSCPYCNWWHYCSYCSWWHVLSLLQLMTLLSLLQLMTFLSLLQLMTFLSLLSLMTFLVFIAADDISCPYCNWWHFYSYCNWWHFLPLLQLMTSCPYCNWWHFCPYCNWWHFLSVSVFPTAIYFPKQGENLFACTLVWSLTDKCPKLLIHNKDITLSSYYITAYVNES